MTTQTQTTTDNGKAIVKASTNALAGGGGTAKELDKKVAEIRQYGSDFRSKYWHVGNAIKEIADKKLWNQRLDEEAKPTYKSFDQFVKAELGMSSGAAYAAMDVAKDFTESQVREIGSYKASLILSAPKEDQAALLDEAKKGKSGRKLKAAVKAKRAAKGVTKRETGRKVMPAGNAGKVRLADKITIASIEGSKVVDLYVTGDATKRARTIDDKPYGVEQLENDVVRYYSVSATPGGDLRIRIVTKREPPPKAEKAEKKADKKPSK
jgi:hypothetical protein